MKLSRIILGFVIVIAVALAFFESGQFGISAQLGRFFGSNHLLQSIEDSSFFPPPLRAAIDAKSGSLTQNGTIEWTNFQRKQNNLVELKANELLNQAAQKKLTDMFAKQYFEHISPSGAGPSDLAKSVGYAYVVVGENLALGNFESDKLLVEAWMNSPGHRANILNTRYSEIGVAVGKGMYEGKEQWLAVQSFGLPLSACPSTDSSLKAELDQNQSEISSLQIQLTSLKAEIDAMDKQKTKEYNNKVARYNNLVERMNSLIDQTKILVEQYNTQVNNFNDCLKE